MSDEIDLKEEQTQQPLGRAKFNCLFIGIGQGGSKIAFTVANKFNAKDDLFYLNTSAADLAALEDASTKDQSFKIGNGEIEGSGKDREASRVIFDAYFAEIIDQVNSCYQELFVSILLTIVFQLPVLFY